MGHAGDDYSQAPPIQGLFIKAGNSVFQALCINPLSFSRFLLSWVFCAIIFILKSNELLWLLISFGLMINGAHANDQNDGLQIWRIPSNPNAWETINNALEAAAVTILACLLIFVVVNRPPRAVPEAGRALPKAALAVPEAAPALPEVAPAFPIYPAVQGDDIDDVLENAPVATRRNSPLESWL